MPYVATRPLVIVEGHGDVESIGPLLRRVSHYHEQYDINPVSRPIRGGALGKFRNPEQLGRYVRLGALRAEADSIIIAVDCDDHCAKVEVENMTRVLQPIAEELQKKIGVCFFVREFECMFLHCMEDIAAHFPDLGILLPCPVSPDKIEGVRDAKGTLSRQMQFGSYKETRDQHRFVHALSMDKLMVQSRTAQHLRNCLSFLKNKGSPFVYP